ncbi:hypothetical protein KAR48_12850 [bacterium]|nr:hypothetical protein [bacterium]
MKITIKMSLVIVVLSVLNCTSRRILTETDKGLIIKNNKGPLLIYMTDGSSFEVKSVTILDDSIRCQSNFSGQFSTCSNSYISCIIQKNRHKRAIAGFGIIGAVCAGAASYLHSVFVSMNSENDINDHLSGIAKMSVIFGVPGALLIGVPFGYLIGSKDIYIPNKK